METGYFFKHPNLKYWVTFTFLLLGSGVFIFYTISKVENTEVVTKENVEDQNQNFTKTQKHQTPKISNEKILNPRTTVVTLSNETESDRIFREDSIEGYPNFPWSFYKKGIRRPSGIRNNCGLFPTMNDLNFENSYWQKSTIKDVEYHLLGAYYDIREKNMRSPTVRILASVKKVILNETTRCQLWFRNIGVVTEPTWNDYIWVRKWGAQKATIYQPYLINCKVPEEHRNKVPTSVSLVGEECDQATNNLKVHFSTKTPITDFAVCVKGLGFEKDISIRLIEWIELLNILGAAKIYFYDLHCHEKVRKMLQYYINMGIVDVTPTSLPGRYPNVFHLQDKYIHEHIAEKRLVEVLPYNDCFYRHMYDHKHIALLDIDEVIMPVIGNWSDLLETITNNLKGEKSSYSVRNVYFLDGFLNETIAGIPEYMHMLQHVYRTKEFTKKGYYVKSFFNTERVLALHNHQPLRCLGNCAPYEIPTELAQMQHYREDCVKDLSGSKCKTLKSEVVGDVTIWRYKDELIKRVNRTLNELNILPWVGD